MKYLITESQFESAILAQFDLLFEKDNLNYTHPYELSDEGEEYEDDQRIDFYIGNYGDDETVFHWYGKNYFSYTTKWKKYSPLLDVSKKYSDILNGLFGKKWYGPLKYWVKKNFDIDVDYITDEVE